MRLKDVVLGILIGCVLCFGGILIYRQKAPQDKPLLSPPGRTVIISGSTARNRTVDHTWRLGGSFEVPVQTPPNFNSSESIEPLEEIPTVSGIWEQKAEEVTQLRGKAKKYIGLVGGFLKYLPRGAQEAIQNFLKPSDERDELKKAIQSISQDNPQ